MRTWRRAGRLLAVMAAAIVGGACGGSSGSPDGQAPTPDPEAAVADAGVPQSGGFDADVTLDGTRSASPAGGHLTYTWTQVGGPDVTHGAGVLTGAQPTFTAPYGACSLLFELRVDDGRGPSEPALGAVYVMEDPTAALFVDGDAGDDAAGDGSRASPFASIHKALEVAAATSPTPDVYVRARAGGAAYDERGATLEVPSGTSLYGGYGDDWGRDPAAARTRVDGASTAIRLQGPTSPAWVSGFQVTATAPLDAEVSVTALLVERNGTALVIEDDELVAEDVTGGEVRAPGTSAAVVIEGVTRKASVTLRGNRIVSGLGGDGAAGADGVHGAAGAPGLDAYAYVPGAAGASGTSGGRGGEGGHGGPSGLSGNGLAGEAGVGSGGSGGSGGGYGDPGGPGHDGDAGGLGADGAGGPGSGSIAGARFRRGDGEAGAHGPAGSGGGGGGGGGGILIDVGTSGGGGGQGGAGGTGGGAGAGGGASIGVWLVGVSAIVEGNTIQTRGGGFGASGGVGAAGGPGGHGGAGGTDCGALCGAAGGAGGAGGTGGTGGHGGAGAGGPSYGIFVGRGLAPTITGNVVVTGQGGTGGADTVPSRAGQGGYSFAVYDADPGDGALPQLAGNTLEPGAPGTGGAEGRTGQAGETNF